MFLELIMQIFFDEKVYKIKISKTLHVFRAVAELSANLLPLLIMYIFFDGIAVSLYNFTSSLRNMESHWTINNQ